MRTLARRLALPAAALSAAFALTACQSGDPKPAPAGDASAAPVKEAPAQGAKATPAPADSSAPTKGSAAGPQEAAPAAQPTAAHHTEAAQPAQQAKPAPHAQPANTASRPTTCTAATAKVVASKVSRPINHLALTVTNTGSRPCDALGAPFVGFDFSQSPIRILEDSKPQAVVTLAPGESAYASLILTGEPGPDTHGSTVKKISVYLTHDSGVTLTAPKGTYADDGAAVSYWQRELSDALTY
ncbi:DUF4232 domain-containing protein [Streptomyces sp. NPDC046203]|uniref:DUF4232 domain-containing protein n=1 Tax=Streptomyces sp. NPDC046203 TaxID=3154602 RepID=UPI0033EDBCAD